MRSYVNIAGIQFIFEGLKIHQTKVFPGCGDVRATAIQRTSKNHYKVHIIVSWAAAVLDFGSIDAACEYLQDTYNRYGTFIPDVGEKGEL